MSIKFNFKGSEKKIKEILFEDGTKFDINNLTEDAELLLITENDDDDLYFVSSEKEMNLYKVLVSERYHKLKYEQQTRDEEMFEFIEKTYKKLHE